MFDDIQKYDLDYQEHTFHILICKTNDAEDLAKVFNQLEQNYKTTQTIY